MLFHDIQGKLERVPPFLDGPHAIWATTDAHCVQPWIESEALNMWHLACGSSLVRLLAEATGNLSFDISSQRYIKCVYTMICVVWHCMSHGIRDMKTIHAETSHPSWWPWSSRGLPRFACSRDPACGQETLGPATKFSDAFQASDRWHVTWPHFRWRQGETLGTPQRWCRFLPRTTNKSQQFINPGLPFSSGKHHQKRTDKWVWGLSITACACL